MYIPPHIRELLIRLAKDHIEEKRTICDTKAAEMGFPAGLGRAIYNGCIDAELDKWDKAQFDKWANGLSESFDRHDWQPLYDEIYKIYNESKKTRQSIVKVDQLKNTVNNNNAAA